MHIIYCAIKIKFKIAKGVYKSMQLTIFTDYGLRCLMFLAAQPERLCSVREVADHYGISYNHLVKVVHRLSQLGYVQSVKGKGGGIQLDRESMNLKLGDIVKTLEPNMTIVECFDRKTNRCRITNNCQLKHFLFDATGAFIDSLNKHTLADTVKGIKPF
jgi:Rrf2 family nitric oxide-sensitive transcriptional repressor